MADPIITKLKLPIRVVDRGEWNFPDKTNRPLAISQAIVNRYIFPV